MIEHAESGQRTVTRVPFFTSDGATARLTTGVCRTGSMVKRMRVGNARLSIRTSPSLPFEDEPHGETGFAARCLAGRASG